MPVGATISRKDGAVDWLLILMYVLLTLAGILAIYFPSPNVANRVAPWVIYVWGYSLAVGGSICAVSIFKKWWGELAGLPPLFGALALYGCAILSQFFNTRSGVLAFAGLVILAFTTILAARWVRVWVMFRLVKEVANANPMLLE